VSDIVEKIRKGYVTDGLATEAIEEITRLRAENERLRRAIESAEPLIEEASGIADGPKGGSVTDNLDFALNFLRRALQETGDDDT
jgi:regulator of replication initiation timing